MKAISIDQNLLQQVHRTLHAAGRVDLADKLLRQVELLQAEYTDNLLCPVHAAKFRRTPIPRIYEHAAHGNLRVYRICCKSFISKQQLERLPKYGHRPMKVK